MFIFVYIDSLSFPIPRRFLIPLLQTTFANIVSIHSCSWRGFSTLWIISFLEVFYVFPCFCMFKRVKLCFFLSSLRWKSGTKDYLKSPICHLEKFYTLTHSHIQVQPIWSRRLIGKNVVNLFMIFLLQTFYQTSAAAETTETGRG